MTNLNNAFEVAEKYLDIPKMLDAEGKLHIRTQQALELSWHISSCRHKRTCWQPAPLGAVRWDAVITFCPYRSVYLACLPVGCTPQLPVPAW